MEESQLTSLIQERYTLTIERIRGIREETFPQAPLNRFFHRAADFLLLSDEKKGQDAEAFRGELLRDLVPPYYKESYADPVYAVSELGKKWGRLFSFLYLELKSPAGYAKPGDREPFLIRMELFTEVYTAFVYEWETEKRLPEYESVRQILYWYAWDYMEEAAGKLFEKLAAGRGPGGECLSILYDGWPWKGMFSAEGNWAACMDDHREDRGLLLDRAYAGRQLEVYQAMLERYGAGLCARTPAEEELPGAEELLRAEELSGGRPSAEKSASIHMEEGQRQLWEKYCRKLAAML